jgi:hypothetical protein
MGVVRSAKPSLRPILFSVWEVQSSNTEILIVRSYTICTETGAVE